MASNSSNIGPPISPEVALQALTNYVFDTRTQTYAQLSAFVFLLYDSLLTWSDEIEFVWKRRIRIGSFLYIIGRISVTMMLSMILFVTLDIIPSGTLQLCRIVSRVLSFWQLATFISINGLLLGRAHAICQGKGWSLIILWGAFAAAVAARAAFLFVTTCDANTDLIRILDIVGSISTNAFEITVIIITILETWKTYQTLKVLLYTNSLMGVLLKQGVLRFIVIFLWGVEQSIAPKLLPPSLVGIDGPLENAVSAILIFRFSLQLWKHISNTRPSLFLSKAEDIMQGSGRTVLSRFNNQITEEFGDRGISSYISGQRNEDEYIEEDRDDQDIPSISSAEFPWAGISMEDIEIGNGKGFK